jgi:thiamine-phosphate pyrophosphorylase
LEPPAIDEEEAEPRFLLIGAGAGPARAECLPGVLAALNPAGLLLRGGSAPLRNGDEAGELLEILRGSAVALLIEDDLDLALAIGADGVHLTSPSGVRSARARLGPDRLLGAEAGLSRHDAMTAGEDGADYVAFGEGNGSARALELVAWWRSIAVLPCLAYAEGEAGARALVQAGADFIGVGAAVWDHEEGPLIGAQRLASALENSLGG